MKTYKATVTGEQLAHEIAIGLMRDSKWFQFMPMGCDEYEITVREENRYRLEEAISLLGNPSRTEEVSATELA